MHTCGCFLREHTHTHAYTPKGGPKGFSPLHTRSSSWLQPGTTMERINNLHRCYCRTTTDFCHPFKFFFSSFLPSFLSFIFFLSFFFSFFSFLWVSLCTPEDSAIQKLYIIIISFFLSFFLSFFISSYFSQFSFFCFIVYFPLSFPFLSFFFPFPSVFFFSSFCFSLSSFSLSPHSYF